MDQCPEERQRIDVEFARTAVSALRGNTYFDLIPQEVAQSLLRRMSSRPRSPAWQSFLDDGDVVSVLRIGGTISAAARNTLTGLILNGDADGRRDLCVNIDTNTGFLLFQSICLELSSSIHRLEFNHLWRPELTFSNLRVLALNSPYGDCDIEMILQPSSGKLRELDISGWSLKRKDIFSISKHCVGLTKLALKFKTLQCSMEELWKVLGSTLEVLSLAEPMYYAESQLDEVVCVGGIAKYCKKVTHFSNAPSFRIDSTRWTFLSYIVRPLRSQLRVLEMIGSCASVSPRDLEVIVAECSQTAIDIQVEKDLIATLRVLGDRLRKLKLLGSSSVFKVTETESLRIAASGCTAVEELIYIEVVPIRYIVVFAALFLAEVKPKMRSVDMRFPKRHMLRQNADKRGHGFYRIRNAAEFLAKSGSSVEKLSIYSRTMDVGVFRALALCNKGLKSIFVKLSRSSSKPFQAVFQATTAAVSLIQNVSVCPFLESIVIHDSYLSSKSQFISNACIPFRGKNVDIYIGGIQYNP